MFEFLILAATPARSIWGLPLEAQYNDPREGSLYVFFHVLLVPSQPISKKKESGKFPPPENWKAKQIDGAECGLTQTWRAGFGSNEVGLCIELSTMRHTGRSSMFGPEIQLF